MTTIACVLRSGGDFEPGHVGRLCDQVWEHAPAGHVDFRCLTDLVEDVDALGIPAVPLTHDWPGWWSKVEVFALEGPVLYLDLDVSIVGDLAPMLEAIAGHDFLISRDFWDVWPHYINTSVMAWRADGVRHLYDQFRVSPVAFMDAYRTGERWNDQGFVRDHHDRDFVFWQDVVPGAVLSYKREVLDGASLERARVVVSHGVPRPWASDGADAWLAANHPRA